MGCPCRVNVGTSESRMVLLPGRTVRVWKGIAEWTKTFEENDGILLCSWDL